MRLTACALLLLAACATRREGAVNRGVRVAAGHFDTGMAVIETFSDQKIPLADPEGGGPMLPGRGADARRTTIVSDTIRLDSSTGRIAECPASPGAPDSPDAAVYHVGFFGSETSTNVVAYVHFSRLNVSTGKREPCRSLHVLESRFERYVKARAERGR